MNHLSVLPAIELQSVFREVYKHNIIDEYHFHPKIFIQKNKKKVFIRLSTGNNGLRLINSPNIHPIALNKSISNNLYKKDCLHTIDPHLHHNYATHKEVPAHDTI